MYCKKCGTEYEGNFCPKGCNSPYYKKKKSGKVALIVVICIFAFAATMGILFGEDSEDASSDNTSVQLIESEENETNAFETQKQIYDKNGIKADFIKLYDPKVGVTAFCVSLKIENNTGEEITVSLSDGYVNDTAVTFTSGLPVTIASGKNAIGVYNFGYDGLGFDKIEDIEKMEFKIAYLNQSLSELKESQKIVLEFK